MIAVWTMFDPIMPAAPTIVMLKALALGADAVLVGRPYCLAAVGGGAEGVKLLTEQLHSQLVSGMVLTGCGSVREAGRHLVNMAKPF